MFNKPQPKVSNIIRVEIEYRLDEILTWIEKGYPNDLLNQSGSKSWNEDGQAIIQYKFDLLPHPNGFDSIIYHHHTRSFNNNIDAIDFLHNIPLPLKKYTGDAIKKFVSGFEWMLCKNSFVMMILPVQGDATSKPTLIIPISDLYQLQIGKTLDDERRYNLKDQLEDIISIDDIFTLDDSEAVKKVYRSHLGLRGKGIQFYNRLCRVKAYLPDVPQLY